MMIGHISDTHLGAFIGRDEELREVGEDVHASFLEAIEIFVREDVDIVIHSGDILDEPTVHLDAEKRRRLRGVLTRLGRKMPPVIVITHDEEVFEGAEARVLRFELGRGATIVSEVESSPSLSAITRN